jgi:hypothetical protein
MTSTIVQKNSKHSKSSKNRTIKKQSVITLPFDHLQISRLHNVPSVFVILFTLHFNTNEVQKLKWLGFDWFMAINVTFNSISFISWWSVVLVEETAVP